MTDFVGSAPNNPFLETADLMPEESDGQRITEPQAKPRDARWWESYAVRYALGVGVGTPVVALLCFACYPALSASTRFAETSLTPTSAVLLAAAGTAFCYVASVPMLTLHSVRNVLSDSSRTVRALPLLVGIALLLAAAVQLFWLNCRAVLGFVGAVILVGLVVGQLVTVWKALSSVENSRDFYGRLAQKRAQNTEYVESYRHLREHGNSVSIVVFELLLAFVLWSLKPVGPHPTIDYVTRAGIILICWLAPPSLVWFLGSALERKLTT